MIGKRRLTITMLGQLLQVLPILIGANVRIEYVLAIASITIFSLLGYNIEEWLRIAKSAREIGDLLIDVADEIDKAAADDMATRPPT